MKRRQFLKNSALAATGAFGLNIIPRRLLGGPGYIPPSEEITRGIIGSGGMAQRHMRMKGRILAICDVDDKQLANGINTCKQAKQQVDTCKDFREILQRDDIDVVSIVTPPHWHGLMTIMAADARKDIWCEKPLTRTISEGKAVMKAVERNNRILRINTWFRYAQQRNFYQSGVTIQTMKKIAESKLPGWPLKVNLTAATGINWKLGIWQGKTDLVEENVPEGFDYDMWLGPAPYKPYAAHRTHRSFRGYWDYDGGGLGDMGQHYLDPFQYVLGKDDTSPVEIIPDTELQHPDAVLPWRKIVMRYADGCEIILDTKEKGQIPLIEGPEGKIYRNLESDIPNLASKVARLPNPPLVDENFFNYVRRREKFPLNEVNGFRSSTLINLAKIAVRLNRPLKFDPDKLEFIDDAEANRYANPPMRAPWTLNGLV